MIFVIVWLTLLSITISKPSHVTENGTISFFLWLIFHFLYPSSADRHLVCFHVLSIENNARMNTGVHASYWIMVFSRYVETEKTPNSQKILEKEKQSWRNPWPHTILQSYSNQNSMVLAEKQKHVDQYNGTESPEINPCSYDHWIYDKRGKNIYNGHKTVSSVSSAGKPGQLQVKVWNSNIFYHETEKQTQKGLKT